MLAIILIAGLLRGSAEEKQVAAEIGTTEESDGLQYLHDVFPWGRAR